MVHSTMSVNNTMCSNSSGFQQLSCSIIQTLEGVTLENHIFLITQLPCCAQLALPYWAKITGKIISNRVEEVFLTIVVTLFDNNDLKLADYTDVMAIEGGEEGEFEVKLIEDGNKAKTYTLTIKEANTLL